MADRLYIKLKTELIDLIADDAARQGVLGGMTDIVAKILADYYGRPDLAVVPRKPLGRHRVKPTKRR